MHEAVRAQAYSSMAEHMLATSINITMKNFAANAANLICIKQCRSRRPSFQPNSQKADLMVWMILPSTSLFRPEKQTTYFLTHHDPNGYKSPRSTAIYIFSQHLQGTGEHQNQVLTLWKTVIREIEKQFQL